MLIPLRGYQQNAKQRARELVQSGITRAVLVSPMGSGKCLAPITPVLRYDGAIVAAGDVLPGDLLMGPDSKPRQVLSTCRGRGPLYRITPIKGDPWVCNDAHILTLVHTSTGDIVDIDVQSYIGSNKCFKNLHKQFSPENGVDFELGATEFPIDPYFLGVWYGDGTKGLNGDSDLRMVAISKPDPEILALCEETARAWGIRVRTDGNGCPTHHLARERKLGAPNEPNPLLDALRRVWGDGQRLPNQYLTAARPHRQAFLAGLLDTDGHLSRNCFDIVQKVKGFAEDICFLARSLGKRALMRPKVVNGETYWRVSLSGDFTDLPLRIPRKIPTKRMQAKCATRTGFSVEPIGDGEYAGFELDGDGRFLLGDFTVTHNTILAASIIYTAVEYGNRVLFVADQRELIRQCFCKLVRAGVPPHDIGIIMANTPQSGSGALFDALDPQLSDRDIWRMFGRVRPGAPVQIASIDTYKNRAKPPADLVIVDECHEALGKGHLAMFANYPDAIFIGLTATPYRSDGRGLGEFWQHLEVVTTTSALMATGDLVDPIVWTVPLDRLPDLASVKVNSKGDFDEDDLAVAMDKPELVGDIVDHWYRRANGIRTVAFATGVQHSKDITAKFRGAGIRAEHLDALTPLDQRDAILSRLETGETHIVVNCGILCLDEQTEILTSVGWVGIDEMTDDHRVANWDDGVVTFERPKQVIRRPRLIGERMVSAAGNSRFDLRVTEGHEMVVRYPNADNWRKVPAVDLVGRVREVPGCGVAEPFDIALPQPAVTEKRRKLLVIKTKYNCKALGGYSEEEAKIEAVRRVDRKLSLRRKSPDELSLDECRLIGFWLGDGSVTKLQTGGLTYVFCQSMANDRIAFWFEALLERLNLHYTKSFVYDAPLTDHEVARWALSRGTGGGSQERRGVFHLEPYLNKGGSSLFWSLSRAQFDALIEGFWKADGDHTDGEMEEGMSIMLHNTNKDLMDLLQAVAVCRGYSTSLTLGGNHRKGPQYKKIYRLYLMQRQTRFVARKTLCIETDDKDERVWCVSVRTGNIITRRNGRAIVVGNCKGWDQPSVKCAILARPTKSKALHRQQVGRVLRPYNGHGAIILDHSGNVRWLGRPEDEGEMTLEPRKKARKGIAAPSCKTCECLAVIPSACRICPMCGHEFSVAASERGAPEEVAGELVQIARSIAAGPDLRAQWDALVERWHKANLTRNVPMKPGWVAKEFTGRTGATRIPEGCELPRLTPEQVAKLARYGELKGYAESHGWSPARLHAVFNAQEKAS